MSASHFLYFTLPLHSFSFGSKPLIISQNHRPLCPGVSGSFFSFIMGFQPLCKRVCPPCIKTSVRIGPYRYNSFLLHPVLFLFHVIILYFNRNVLCKDNCLLILGQSSLFITYSIYDQAARFIVYYSMPNYGKRKSR